MYRCYICGSLFSTDAPDCPVFNKSDPKQQKICEIGEACLYYSWQKSDIDTGRLLTHLVGGVAQRKTDRIIRNRD